MNDLSARTNFSNGYAPNMRHTITHKPVIGTKSMGFIHKKRGVKYSTTKSLPLGATNSHTSWKSVSGNGGSGVSSSHRGISSMTSVRHLQDKKERIIKYFDIELDKADTYIHRPGEELNGTIQMDVAKSIEIRFLELIVVGQGIVTLRKNKHGLTKTQKETYLSKRTYVIGTGDARWTSVLTPGHYVSNFKIKLPKDIPSSISYTDMATGVSIEIIYFLKARICDDIGSASMRSIVTLNNAVKVLLSKKKKFSVQRAFDLHLIPNAMTPVVNEEEVILSCGSNSVAHFTLGLDRSLFLAGDDIRLQLSTQIPSSQHVKNLTCILRQHITLKEIGLKESFILSDMSRRNPRDYQTKNGPFTMMSLDITIPTPTHLVSAYMIGCKSLQVTYTLDVIIKLRPAGGQVSFTIPISMGPCAEPIYAEKTASRKFVPVFNRPVRFPCFSPSPQKSSSLQPDRKSQSSQSINVVTQYQNSVMKQCFLCCLGGSTSD